MARHADRYLDRLLHRRALRFWRRGTQDAEHSDKGTLIRRRDAALALGAATQAYVRACDRELAHRARKGHAAQRPLGADVLWRPEVSSVPLPTPGQAGVHTQTALGGDVTLFHDCPRNEIIVRQRAGTGLALFMPQFEVFAFEGSFLSLAIALPPRMLSGLQARHVIGLQSQIDPMPGGDVFCRLSIEQDAQTLQIDPDVVRDGHMLSADFDLAFSALRDAPITQMWIDLIFASPAFAKFTLSELCMTRRPRAEL